MNIKDKPEFIVKSILFILCLCFIAIHYSTLLFSPYVQRDVGLHLTSGKMILEGCRPYVELVDTNPPFAMYLNVIPAFIAKLTGIRLIMSGYLFYMLLEALSCFLFVYILARGKYLKSWLEGLVAVSFFLLASHWAYSLRSFGQRDHFIAMFLAVFSIYRYSLYSKVQFSRLERIIFSSLAFCMLAMKLHFLLLIIAGEIILTMRYKFDSKRYFPDFIIFIVMGIVYLSHFYMIPRMSEFYSYWLGFIAKGYSVFNISASSILLNIYKEHVIFIIIFGLNLLIYIPYFMSKCKKHFLPVFFTTLANVSIIIYFLQSKGWLYHLLPFFMFSFIGWFFFSKGIASNENDDYSHVLQIVLLLSFVSFFYSSEHIFSNNKLKPILRFSDYDFETVINKFSTTKDKLMFIDITVNPAFPALTYSGRSNASRLLSGFPLAFIFKSTQNYKVPKEFIDDEVKYFLGLVEDIAKNKPKLIFIRNGKKLLFVPEYFNPTEYLKRRNFFSHIAETYKKIGSGYGFDVFLRLKEKIPPSL